MKLMQANIWGGRLESQVTNFVRDYQPDIICLQEVIHIPGSKAFMFASLEDIQEAAGLPHAFMSAGFTFNFMSRQGQFGNAILSRFPMSNKQTIFTGGKHIDDFDTIEDSANIRNLQIAEVKLPNGNSLHVLNHHGHHIHQHKNGDQETMRQCTIIANEVAKLDGKVILTGDFNLSPDSESIQLINNHLRNLSIEHKLKTTRNMLTHKTEVCDYIFASSDVQVDGFAVADEIISDHQVLQLEFS